jgi:demethylmenaquinone methyltransferase/2-methoxy-6-polyprenyl-1,4-benzoquinol methylase
VLVLGWTLIPVVLAAIPSAATSLFGSTGALTAEQALALATATVAAAVTLGVPAERALMSTDRDLIDEQIAYYRARAREYDATSPSPEGDPFGRGANAVRDALRAFAARGRVIELAAGTGQWTGLLAGRRGRPPRDDSSPEMLDLNREKTGLATTFATRWPMPFALDPTADRDVVFFGSSCPTCRPHASTRSGAAWPACWPGGSRFLRRRGSALPVARGLGRRVGGRRAPPASPTGRSFRAVKVLWTADELEGPAGSARLGRFGPGRDAVLLGD